jgi:hypothetical protein
MAESQRLSRFLVALSCFVVVGLTWAFGLVAIGPMRILFQILFCTFASLTGFFIFVLYIVTSRAKRTCWNSKFIDSLSYSFSYIIQMHLKHSVSHQSILHHCQHHPH